MRLEEEINQKQFRNEFHKLAVNIIYTASWMKLKTQHVLRPHGISSEQYNVLRILRGQYPNPASVNMIIDRMLDKNSNASRIVDKLIEKDLVIRKESLTDRRQVDVFINANGQKLLEEIDMDNANNELFQLISTEEAAKINQILDKIRG